MKLNRALFSGVVVVLLNAPLASADAKEDAIKKDRKRYEGTWQVESIELNGVPLSEEQAKGFKIINEADGKWSIEQDGKVVASGTSEIDPSMSPKTVDLTQKEGSGAGQVLQGIYDFPDDDTRKVCFALPGKARPTEFGAPAGSNAVMVVMKKLKKK